MKVVVGVGVVQMVLAAMFTLCTAEKSPGLVLVSSRRIATRVCGLPAPVL